jgi:hypothetical protein
MKLLKISFAVLLFSFLGSMQNQVLAQEPTKNAGYWGRTLSNLEYLENGDFRAKLQNHPTNAHWVQLIIYKASDNSVVKSLLVSNNQNNTKVKSLQFDTSGGDPNIWLSCTTDAQTDKVLNLSTAARNSYWDLYKALDKTTEVTSYAYFQLENDGRFVIYHSTVGMFNSAGTPIVELTGN